MLTREMFNYPRLIVEPQVAEARLVECIDFVNTKRPDLEDNLKGQFDRLANNYDDNTYAWGCMSRNRLEVKLYHDFAPLSFYFEEGKVVDGEWKRWMNGGIIFHGKHDGGGNGGAPTQYQSYILSKSYTKDGWRIHT